MTRNIPKELEDCYEVLGLKPGASAEEIKGAFRQVSKDGIHPDAGGTAAQFRVVQGCYEKLMNFVTQQSSGSSSSTQPPENASSHSAPYSEPKLYPRVELDKQSLQFDATHHYGEKLTQTIVVNNADSTTLLEGKWEVAAHPSDPPHTPDNHDWISVTPGKFFCQNNRVNCQIQIDTRKLRRLERYERQLILHSNASVLEHRVTIDVQTGDLPFKVQRNTPYLALGLLLLVSGLLGWLGVKGYLSSLANIMASPLGLFALLFILPSVGIALIGGILGALISGLRSGLSEAKKWILNGLKVGAVVALVYVLGALFFLIFTNPTAYLIFLAILFALFILFVVSSLSGTY